MLDNQRTGEQQNPHSKHNQRHFRAFAVIVRMFVTVGMLLAAAALVVTMLVMPVFTAVAMLIVMMFVVVMAMFVMMMTFVSLRFRRDDFHARLDFPGNFIYPHQQLI